ncbi:MAG: hypothetical protein LBK42_01895 [Propionibacteriaceae bacterium]|jgi:hypothetical protein|nr:hypothetical protein [Propionibacteriaceae bacterium]
MTDHPAVTLYPGLAPAEPVAVMTSRPVAVFALDVALAEPAERPPL